MIRSHILRSLCQYPLVSNTRKFGYYVTTPIFYVNASPHIGHVHTLLLADAINIFNRLRLNCDKTIFSTGTDEHGIKIQTAASASNKGRQEFCDLNASKFIRLFEEYNTTTSDFIRTTEERHKEAVRKVWMHLDEGGYIYKSTYSGWYCASDEVFVPDAQVKSELVDGRIVHYDQNGNVVVWSHEKNFMFRLSQFEDQIRSWLQRDKPIVPEKFGDILIKSMEQNCIGDISISRPKSRLEWGIPVPAHPDQTIYVWLDALTNYLTVAGYPCHESMLKRWPVDCHVLGKDILKFHAIYWPAFLMALSLPLPKRLLCHSHWTLESLKMSKSKGNVIDPWEENKLLTAEGLRYYLLRASTNHSDTDYSRLQALRRVNAELADTYGNLMSRCSGRAINPRQVIPKNLIDSHLPTQFHVLIKDLQKLASACEEDYEKGDFYKGIDRIMATLRLNNKIYEDAEPWKLVKLIASNQESFNIYHNLQALTFETLRICSILLQPIVPRLSDRALSFMIVGDRSWRDACFSLESGSCDNIINLIDSNFVLFKRLK